MPTNRFHKAAEDGMLEILKESTTRDCNEADKQGMTPTLYAAFRGNLEALKLLCGRGGDPDKADIFGNTALHLAAAQGHKAIVTFLVNFGANIYPTDVDGRTAQELAGISNHDHILQFLDSVRTKLEAEDKKKSKTMQERAKKDSEKRKKLFDKQQKKKEKNDKVEKPKVKSHTASKIETLKTRIKEGPTFKAPSHQAPRHSFSAMVATGSLDRNVGSVQRKALAKAKFDVDDFKISEIEDGKRSIRSLTGIRGDSEVLYTKTVNTSKRERLENVFSEAEVENLSKPPPPAITIQRSHCQPDSINELDTSTSEPPSLFIRPGMGTLVFRKSISSAVFNSENSHSDVYESSSNLSHTSNEFSDSDSDDDYENPLERFLAAWDLDQYLPKFEKEKIDLQTLMLLTEGDLKSLGLPLGHLRSLEKAINERKAALEVGNSN